MSELVGITSAVGILMPGDVLVSTGRYRQTKFTGEIVIGVRQATYADMRAHFPDDRLIERAASFLHITTQKGQHEFTHVWNKDLLVYVTRLTIHENALEDRMTRERDIAEIEAVADAEFAAHDASRVTRGSRDA